jgi:predicted transposase YdaD
MASRDKAPAQRFDTTLKKLFQTLPSRLIEMVTGGRAVELLTIELPSVKQRRADLVFRLPDDEIHQIELQGDNDEAMDPRMLEYYVLLWEALGQPPVQHVLYVGAAPLKMTGRVKHRRLKYSYGVTDIREFDAELLLKSASPADNLVAVLCRNGTEPATVRKILRRLARLPQKQQMDSLEQLLIISGLRKVEPVIVREVHKMGVELNIRDNPFLSGIFAEGKAEGEANMLRRMLEQRFGKLPRWAVEKLTRADVGQLEQWSLRIFDARELEDVLPRKNGASSRSKR